MKKGLFKQTGYYPLLCLLLLAATQAHADEADFPTISIIIDDIGYRYVDDINALNLPGPITYAILPHSPFAKKMSQLAHAAGKDIILHIPMQPIEASKNPLMGPGGLKLEMDKIHFIATLRRGFRSVPNAIGANNHMGSLLTMDDERMGWLMEYLKIGNFFYVDSMTNPESVASEAADRINVPYLKRDIFLDNSKNREDIIARFDELIKVAKRRGHAIAIGHPHPETIEVLRNKLQRLDEYGVHLISLREMVGQQQQLEFPELRKVSQN